MCGIIGGISNKNITPLLINGLKKLEYRGYDSSGLVVQSNKFKLLRLRASGKVNHLEQKLKTTEIKGKIGLAHTRWATHGEPSNKNAHPHISNNSISVVHNGIIENYVNLKKMLITKGYKFASETDTEVIAHLIDFNLKSSSSLLEATQKTLSVLKGSYGIGVISSDEPNTLIAAKKGSPLLIGIGKNENFIASDQMALLSVTKRFIFLEEDDVAEITKTKVVIYNLGRKVKRSVHVSNLKEGHINIGKYDHFMQKEIFEQPQAIRDTLESRILSDKVVISSFGYKAKEVFKKIKQVQIVACGSSYNAGLVAKYWLEDIAKISCNIEVASEYRYRNPVILDNTLLIAISQSGETADLIEAIKIAKKISDEKILILSITNSAESSITRMSNLSFLTNAGPEIGVASTKAFTTQLVGLALLTCSIGVIKNNINAKQEKSIIAGLKLLPGLIMNSLMQETQIKELVPQLLDKNSALFLGRGTMHAIAMEGALKLKEISYIHAEAFPAGELKHGPIALIDETTPVIAVAPNDELINKLKSNLLEVKSRGSEMIVFEDEDSKVIPMKGMKIIPITSNIGRITAPIIFTIPLQLLSYHVALAKGTDVDKPRNLAKSVTVE
jgi:glutamine---fructose-6-phosphate transaminase (isomerizing)